MLVLLMRNSILFQAMVVWRPKKQFFNSYITYSSYLFENDLFCWKYFAEFILFF